ncbi:MAG: hypothetical protein NT087_03280 [Deltaproteobacteria bacterium]|nr:hypothetical protein [Deltaproteobacteria bacterium]
MDFLPWQVKVGAGVILAVALIGGYFAWANHQQGIGEDRATAACNLKIDTQKKEAATTLAKETARVVATERALQDFKNHQEVKDADNKSRVASLTARLRDLAVNGRLLDPHADPGCGGSGSGSSGTAPAGPGNRPDNGADAGGLLSADLSRLLQRLTVEADTINNAYISCRADAEAVRVK